MDPEVIDEVEVEELSLRDSLEEAIEEHDPGHELVPPASESAPSAAVPSEGAAPPEAAPKDATVAEPSSAAVPPTAQPPAAALQAPAQWKPAVREKWNALPREVQEEIHRRESDSMRLIGSVGPKIRIADEVAQHMQPFAERLQAAGASPSAFMGDVFSSIKVLAGDDPRAKAEVVANIVQSYGIDVRDLDAVLTHRIKQPPEVHAAREAIVRANAIVAERNAGMEQQSTQAANQALAVFAADPKHEFFDNVRHLMADLIDTGQAKTLEDAYSAAIWADGSTRKILLQREAQSRATAKNTRATAARRASSSVHGSPSLNGAANPIAESDSLRGAIEAAYEEHSSL